MAVVYAEYLSAVSGAALGSAAEVQARARFVDAAQELVYEQCRVAFHRWLQDTDVPLTTTGTAHLSQLLQARDVALVVVLTEYIVSDQRINADAGLWTLSESWVTGLDAQRLILIRLLRDSLYAPSLALSAAFSPCDECILWLACSPSNSISAEAIEGLEFMLYRSDPVLMAAYDLYEKAHFSHGSSSIDARFYVPSLMPVAHACAQVLGLSSGRRLVCW
jgi:hypothetical protein